LPLVLSTNIRLIFGCETLPILIIPRLTGRLAERGLALLNVKSDVQEGKTTGRSCRCISVFICQEDAVDFFSPTCLGCGGGRRKSRVAVSGHAVSCGFYSLQCFMRIVGRLNLVQRKLTGHRSQAIRRALRCVFRLYAKAVVTTTIRFRFDDSSTAYKRSLRS